MLLSMTGFGEARSQTEQVQIAVEIRSVNNRYFKLNLRWPESLTPFESELEKLVREKVGRGTVSLLVRLERMQATSSTQIHDQVLAAYWRQLNDLAIDIGAPAPNLQNMLHLPGVLAENVWTAEEAQTLWQSVHEAVQVALERLQEFRDREGQAMSADLLQNLGHIRAGLEKVTAVAPQVVVEYRDRLLERMNELLKASEGSVSSVDLIREVSLFADRCDINEEITRLNSHLNQFDKFVHEKTSQGRKIEFLLQEMFREINTIGSKANNVSIAHAVVDMKAAVERMREVIQNVE